MRNLLFRLVVLLGLPAGVWATTPDELERAAHALNRLGYGPRPGEVERVAAAGVENWMRAQLDPARLPDPAGEQAIASLALLRVPPAELVQAYQEDIRQRREAAKAGEAGKGKEGERMMEMEREGRLKVAQAVGELQYAKLARAVVSEHQLEEVLVDFWFNHFNVDTRKQQVRATIVTYEQDTIRPHVFGSFRDLLGATARSAAMLVYLDNARSSKAQELGPREQARQRRMLEETVGMSEEQARAATPGRRGLNENYGRELLELHTLGVDGGYTQADVQAVARAFTGWTVDPRNGQFVFALSRHDADPKIVLGRRLTSSGRREAEEVMDLLATHPATARRIAFKLCQRFVADAPPEALVKRVADAYLASGGNLRATYEALFFAPEFFAAEHRRAKIKSPFEYTVSALRASGAALVDPPALRGRAPLRAMEAGAALGRGERLANLPRRTVLMHLPEMGLPLYAWGPPTGFPEDSSHWVSAGALVSRLNFALALTGGQVVDARVDVRPLLGGLDTDSPDDVVQRLGRSVLGTEPAPDTVRVLKTQIAAKSGGPQATADSRKILALLLGSPEFQRR